MKIKVDNKAQFKKQVLQWAQEFAVCSFFDSNEYDDKYTSYDCIIAAGYLQKLATNYYQAFEQLKKFRAENPGWMIGGLGYDLKNDTETLQSGNPDYLNFPDCFFYVPQHLLLLKGDELEIISPQENLYEEIRKVKCKKNSDEAIDTVAVQSRLSKKEYTDRIKKIQQHIVNGDIYESNFCLEFYNENLSVDPQEIFQRLNKLSASPFSSYFKWFDRYILCASPERFLAKRGNKLISQPIKGTAKRGFSVEDDEILKQELFQHPKERQENVMIVDLVRNDLTKSAKKGSVKVEELFGIYSFKQVHQMISTVVCESREDLGVIEILENTFPMGSMTGAPKIKAMQLMELYEESKRGIYSGAIGYIAPDNDFDFNVVIRSILYNASSQYLSFHAGSAITYYADAEKEYEECLLKINGLLKAVNGFLHLR